MQHIPAHPKGGGGFGAAQAKRSVHRLTGTFASEPLLLASSSLHLSQSRRRSDLAASSPRHGGALLTNNDESYGRRSTPARRPPFSTPRNVKVRRPIPQVAEKANDRYSRLKPNNRLPPAVHYSLHNFKPSAQRRNSCADHRAAPPSDPKLLAIFGYLAPSVAGNQIPLWAARLDDG